MARDVDVDASGCGPSVAWMSDAYVALTVIQQIAAVMMSVASRRAREVAVVRWWRAMRERSSGATMREVRARLVIEPCFLAEIWPARLL